jgi:hypothetical protein
MLTTLMVRYGLKSCVLGLVPELFFSEGVAHAHTQSIGG